MEEFYVLLKEMKGKKNLNVIFIYVTCSSFT